MADADSQGWSDLYGSLLSTGGTFGDDAFEGIADPIVYLYRFALHPDFGNWKMAAFDVYCRLFLSDAILVDRYRTHLSLEEFKAVGFNVWPGYGRQAPTDAAVINGTAGWMVRDNALATDLQVDGYPKNCAEVTAEHLKWLKSRRLRGYATDAQ